MCGLRQEAPRWIYSAHNLNIETWRHEKHPNTATLLTQLLSAGQYIYKYWICEWRMKPTASSLHTHTLLSTWLANSRKAILARSYNVVLPSLFVIGAVQNCRLEIMFVCVCVVFLLGTLRLQNSIEYGECESAKCFGGAGQRAEEGAGLWRWWDGDSDNWPRVTQPWHHFHIVT